MSKNTTRIIFFVCLLVSLTLVLLIHGIEWEGLIGDEGVLFVAETTLYLTGLGTLFFGWWLIDHKFPSKRDRHEH